MPREFDVVVRIRLEAASQNRANELACELSETLAIKLREQDAAGRIEEFRCHPTQEQIK